MDEPKPLKQWLEDLKTSGEKQWIIPGVIPKGGIVLISGHQKRAQKTFFCMLLSYIVATGVKRGILNPEETGKVLCVLEEGGAIAIGNRFEAIAKGLGLEVTPENVYILFRKVFKLDQKDHAKMMLEWVEKERPAMVVLDPFYRLITGDENSQVDVNLAIDTVMKIRNLGATVVLLAHLSQGKGENKKADIDSQVRGSGLITNAYDVHCGLRRYDMKDKLIELTLRNRDAEEKYYSMLWTLRPKHDDPNALSSAILDIEEDVDIDV